MSYVLHFGTTVKTRHNQLSHLNQCPVILFLAKYGYCRLIRKNKDTFFRPTEK